MAVLMLFCSNAEFIGIVSSALAVDAGETGVGVYNRVLTDASEAPVVYRVRFYGYNEEEEHMVEVTLTQGYEFGDLYLDQNGTIELPNNTGVNFLTNTDLMEYLDSNGVLRITIEPDEDGNSTVVADDAGNPVNRSNYQTYYTAKQLTSMEYFLGHVVYLLFEGEWALADL